MYWELYERRELPVLEEMKKLAQDQFFCIYSMILYEWKFRKIALQSTNAEQEIKH